MDRTQALAEKKKEQEESSKKWAAEQFGLKPDEIIWYNSGSCYDSIIVTTQEAADKVSAKVAGGHVNGGMLGGMALGGQSKDDRGFRVTC